MPVTLYRLRSVIGRYQLRVTKTPAPGILKVSSGLDDVTSSERLTVYSNEGLITRIAAMAIIFVG